MEKTRNLKKKLKNNFYKLKFKEKVVQVSRVTKVVTGGKRLSFRAVIVIGNSERQVGVGIGRGEDVSLAINKAISNAKRNLIAIPITINDSIPHVINSQYGACKIMLRPASSGTGVIAGGSVRTVLELAGIKNVLAKQFGSSNPLNNAKATILALMHLNEKVEIGKHQSVFRQKFYNRVMKSFND